MYSYVTVIFIFQKNVTFYQYVWSIAKL